MKKKGPAADSKLPPTFSPGPARPPFRIPEFRYVTLAESDQYQWDPDPTSPQVRVRPDLPSGYRSSGPSLQRKQIRISGIRIRRHLQPVPFKSRSVLSFTVGSEPQAPNSHPLVRAFLQNTRVQVRVLRIRVRFEPRICRIQSCLQSGSGLICLRNNHGFYIRWLLI